MKKWADKLKCKNCKYKTNIANMSETGSAICSYPSSWFPVNIEDNCHFIPEKKEITCSDCSRLHEDMACFSCSEDDSAIFNGQLCRGFIDKRKEELKIADKCEKEADITLSDIEKMNMYDIKVAHIKEDKQRIIEIEGKFSGIDTLKNLLKM